MSSRWAIQLDWKRSWRRSLAVTESRLLHFFFYGTLIAGSGNVAARVAHARLRPIGSASVSGTLWAIPDAAGWYPALVASASGSVHGVLYEATAAFGPSDLALLDQWEDYRPDKPGDSLYLREVMQVAVADGTSVAAQVYCFNQPLPAGALAISDGDFPAWLNATGHSVYGA